MFSDNGCWMAKSMIYGWLVNQFKLLLEMFYTDQMNTSKSLRKIAEIRHFHIAHPTLVTSRNLA